MIITPFVKSCTTKPLLLMGEGSNNQNIPTQYSTSEVTIYIQQFKFSDNCSSMYIKKKIVAAACCVYQNSGCYYSALEGLILKIYCNSLPAFVSCPVGQQTDMESTFMPARDASSTQPRQIKLHIVAPQKKDFQICVVQIIFQIS